VDVNRYPGPIGLGLFRTAISNWFSSRFGVRLDPSREVALVIGTKEGIAHLSLALLDPGSVAIVPDPGYPAYRAASLLAGAEPIPLALDETQCYQPDLRHFSPGLLKKARLLFVNYPHNPTGAVTTPDRVKDLIRIASANGLVICNDATYSEIRFDGAPQTSALQAFGPESPVIEFYSCSKTFALPGWRLGFAVGNASIIAALRRVKSAVDLGQFCAFQTTIARVMEDPRTEPYLEHARSVYQRRRDLVVTELQRLDIEVYPPQGAFYVWFRTRSGISSRELVHRLRGRGLMLSPGETFGVNGRNRIRLSLTASEEELTRATRLLGSELEATYP
jgi:LL-diaminopimelate aminotransferase